MMCFHIKNKESFSQYYEVIKYGRGDQINKTKPERVNNIFNPIKPYLITSYDIYLWNDSLLDIDI